MIQLTFGSCNHHRLVHLFPLTNSATGHFLFDKHEIISKDAILILMTNTRLGTNHHQIFTRRKNLNCRICVVSFKRSCSCSCSYFPLPVEQFFHSAAFSFFSRRVCNSLVLSENYSICCVGLSLQIAHHSYRFHSPIVYFLAPTPVLLVFARSILLF